MPDIQFECPHCQHILIVDDQAAGLSLPCPRCEATVRVPEIPVGRLPKPPADPIAAMPGLTENVLALRNELQALQGLVDDTATRFDALGQWSARQGREMDHLGQASRHVDAKVQEILKHVSRVQTSSGLVVPADGEGTVSAGGASTTAQATVFWRGMTVFWSVLAVLAMLLLLWIWTLAKEKEGERVSLAVSPIPRILRPPELTKNERVHVAWELAALPRRDGESAVLRAVLRNPSITRELWLKDLVADARIFGRERRVYSHRASLNPAGLDRLSPGGEVDVLFWLPEADAANVVSLLWYPGVWVEDGGEKIQAFAGPLDISLVETRR